MNKKDFRLSILLCLLIFASAGISACILSDQYGCRLDLTENKLYTLSDETKSLLDELETEVSITVFNTKTDYPAIITNLLDSYSSHCDKLRIAYCDPYHEPRKVKEISEQGFNISLSDIAVQGESGAKVLGIDSLYQLDESESTVTCLMAEQQLSSAIVSVIQPEKGKVLFTDGHGETPSASLMALFENNHYNTSYAELSVLGIDDDTNLIIICAPQKDASEEEIALLGNYMERGGAVCCFMEPGSARLTRFSEFLAERGIGLTDETLREPSLCLSGNELSIIATYANHEINSYFAENRRYVAEPSASAVEQLYVKQGRTKTQEILRTSSDARTADGVAGSRGLCVSSLRESTSAKDSSVEQKLVVFGSKLIYGDDLMRESKLANSDFIMQTAAWLIEDEELLNIPVKNLGTDILPATTQLVRSYVAVMTVGVPFLILAVGFAVYIRRRYL